MKGPTLTHRSELLSHWMKEGRCHTVFINVNGKRRSTYLKKPDPTCILQNFQEQGKPHLQHYLQEKKSLQRGTGKAPRTVEDSRILSIPLWLVAEFFNSRKLQSKLFGNNSGNIYAILDKSLSI